MDPLTVTVASAVALAGVGTSARWRLRARRAEARTAQLRRELAAERHAACHDPLTSLPNRRAFYEIGTAVVRQPTDRQRVVVLVDLDDFKEINDQHGHAAGDEVLVTVARRFEAFAGDNLVARLGGDEFVGLLTSPSSDPTLDGHWQYLANRRLTEILNAPMTVAGHTLTVSASVGLAPVAAEAGLPEAVRNADAAMYRAKTRYRAATRHIPTGHRSPSRYVARAHC